MELETETETKIEIENKTEAPTPVLGFSYRYEDMVILCDECYEPHSWWHYKGDFGGNCELYLGTLTLSSIGRAGKGRLTRAQAEALLADLPKWDGSQRVVRFRGGGNVSVHDLATGELRTYEDRVGVPMVPARQARPRLYRFNSSRRSPDRVIGCDQDSQPRWWACYAVDEEGGADTEFRGYCEVHGDVLVLSHWHEGDKPTGIWRRYQNLPEWDRTPKVVILHDLWTGTVYDLKSGAVNDFESGAILNHTNLKTEKAKMQL